MGAKAIKLGVAVWVSYAFLPVDVVQIVLVTVDQNVGAIFGIFFLR